MRSLRTRLFVSILGAVVLAVGASLAIGIVLTRSTVRDSIADEVAAQADAIAGRVALAPGQAPLDAGPFRPRARRRGLLAPRQPGAGRRPPGGGTGTPPSGERPPAGPGPPGPPPEGGPRPQVLPLRAASRILPADAAARVRAGKDVDGTGELHGREEIFSARPVRDVLVLVSRSDSLSSEDFGGYLTGLLLAAGLAAILAAVAAALLARRLAAPLHRVAEATRALAAGGRPEPLPPERTTELAAVVDGFNDMSTRLARAREAERSVLLSVSHDLRTPLTAVRGYAEGIEDGTVEPGEAAPVIRREADRLERLVGDLLALAQLDQGVLEVRPEPVDLGELAREAQGRLSPQARAAGVALAVEADSPAPAVADPGRTLQVISNLAENALRVTPQGGTVTIVAAPGEVAVSDTGPGIPADEQERAFERFHLRRSRGRGSPDGAGLGLAIVRELAEAMGGSVGVESGTGAGATFTVRLPTRPPEA